jgi:F-type H+-transporting ATPase subunit delta
MAEKRTIARPYAKALFAIALEQQRLAQWSQALGLFAGVVSDERVRKLLVSPHVTPSELADWLIGLAGNKFDEQGRNFIRTLAANRRLGFLPEIAAIFERLKAESENTADVTVISATPLDAEQKQRYAAALQKRLKREVRLHVEVDPALVGGAILRADDLVIDGSLRGRLERLAAEVTG